jgi:hypothetical protein
MDVPDTTFGYKMGITYITLETRHNPISSLQEKRKGHISSLDREKEHLELSINHLHQTRLAISVFSYCSFVRD